MLQPFKRATVLSGEKTPTLSLVWQQLLNWNVSFDSRNFKKWGRSPTTTQNVGDGDDFIIKFKLMKIANLISKLNFYKLIPYPMDNYTPSPMSLPSINFLHITVSEI